MCLSFEYGGGRGDRERGQTGIERCWMLLCGVFVWLGVGECFVILGNFLGVGWLSVL